MGDMIGKFHYNAAFFTRYAPFFEAAQALPPDATVLVIGANDGILADPSNHVWQDGWTGVFVEPNPYVVEKLKRNRAGLVIQKAVSNEPGKLHLYTMTPDAAAAYEKVGANGTALTSSCREHIESRIRKNMPDTMNTMGLENMIERIEVECVPVRDLKVKPDLIQIDIEGMEQAVVPDCLDLGAKIVLWEHQHLNDAEKGKLEALARGKGYTTRRLRNDSMAVMT